MTTLASTKIARNALRSVKPRIELWTNLYKNCRTVKCYAYDDAEIDAMKSAIAVALPDATVKTIVRQSWYTSVIVRLPLEEI